ncbi:MAG: Type secretion system hydrolase TadA/VirB11/CpaF, TadA subfamily [Myxococcaceae bacterium]|nr:Type secretion system hydrolase TadA/VirB11/CpaF, TadA subfamily [Myxococcaceae bacterium]
MIPEIVFNATLLSFFDPVRRYLDDPSVTEIMINGPGKIYIERKGKLQKVEEVFPNVKSLYAALRNTAQYVGKHVDEERPLLEGRLPDGSRVAAVLPPAGNGGPYVAIRRFFGEKLTMQRLLDLDSITPDGAEMIRVLVESKQNVVIAGGTSSGKTSLLNAVSELIPEDERVVVIEDSKELALLRDHVVTLEGRPADAKGRGEVTIRHLFRITLRMRPDRIVIGELRGGEALDLVQAMTSGHGGCLTTLHATYPRDVLTRLETMAMMADIEMPLAAMRAQIASAVDIVIQAARYRDGTRKVTHISEILGFDMSKGTYQINDLFIRKVKGVDPNGTVLSKLVPTGNLPDCMETIRAAGLDVPASVHEANWRREQQAGKS